MGAYLSTFAPCIPTYLYATLLAGVYKTPAIYCRGEGGVHQHRAGGRLSRRRPAGGDLPAGAAGGCMRARHRHRPRRDPAARTSFPPDAFPYQTPVALQYDSGNYQATLDAALKAADYAGFEARRGAAAAKGKLRGIGISTYIEACGIAPSRRGRLARRARRAVRGARTSACIRPAA